LDDTIREEGRARFAAGGLTDAEVLRLRERHGTNELGVKKKEGLFAKTLRIAREPMFLLLIAAAAIYFILGEPRDSIVMIVFVVVIIGIDVIQEWKTDRTMDALKELSAPHITVLRGGEERMILSAELVPGDIMMIHEGVKIPADGHIIKCSDLRADESSLTGEPEGVWKTAANGGEAPSGYWRSDYCYAGTLVTHGTAVVCVDKTGTSTEYGKIGANVAGAAEEKTPLQRQTGRLVRACAYVAAALFVLAGVATWVNIPDHYFADRLIESVISGITLAMAMIPEEFPVILTVFLSMGAWRLAKKSSLVRRLPSVETLGAVSVLCVDKTGTITTNRMAVREVWAPDGDVAYLCETMGLACETDAYDPMEVAVLEYCEANGIPKTHLFGGELITEYAFTDELKMMGHVWRHDGGIIVTVKGSPERVLALCRPGAYERGSAEEVIRGMSGEGLRVIAAATAELTDEDAIPPSITDCTLDFRGVVGFADPPREDIKADIEALGRAGIRVVMITGDSGATAASIARQTGIKDHDSVITGAALDTMSDEELRGRVGGVGIFSRVIPEHKMRIVKALKENGEVVAMTGDGVNDAPALKHADIGIAMGRRGSEASRESADLILTDDNFRTIVETVRDGRRIYDNIRKAVRYVLAIHIPIALASLLAPVLRIDPADLMFLPLHVVLLELIIDPTCSIVLERQPAESDIMERKPRDPKESLLDADSLIKSCVQGLAIFCASFGTYVYVLSRGVGDAAVARSMGLAVIMLANLFLVQVNSSESDPLRVSARRLAGDKLVWAINLITVAGLLAFLYTPLAGFLKFAPLTARQLLSVAALSAASVLWYEALKWANRRRADVRKNPARTKLKDLSEGEETV